MTQLFKIRHVSIALALGVLLCCSLSSGQSAGDSKAKARAVLSKAADHLAGKESFALKAQVSYKWTMNQGGTSHGTSVVTDYTIAFERPDAISVHMINPDREMLYVSDGQRYIRYVTEFKQYVDSAEEIAAAEVIATSGIIGIAPALEVLSEVV